MAASLFPHFTQLLAEGRTDVLASEYHRWTQMLMVAALPVCGLLVVFPKPLLEMWLGAGSPMVASTSALMPWVALGTLLNTVMLLPFCLQMAAGWTRLSVLKNALAIAVVVPVLSWGVPRLGPVLGTWCWFALNLSYYTLEAPLMHRRLLRGELASWWLRDTLLPAGIALAVFWLAAVAARAVAGSLLASVAAAAGAALVASALLALALPHPRAALKRAWRRWADSSTRRSLP
jgi:O-antigen/teichoic acid export membrane protein